MRRRWHWSFPLCSAVIAVAIVIFAHNTLARALSAIAVVLLVTGTVLVARHR